MSPFFGLHHVCVEKCRIAGRPRLVVRHVSNGIPRTQVAKWRYSAAQRTTAEEVDSCRSPWDQQRPKSADSGRSRGARSVPIAAQGNCPAWAIRHALAPWLAQKASKRRGLARVR